MNFSIVALCGAVVGVIVILFPLKELKNNYFLIAVAALSLVIAVYSLKGAHSIFLYLETLYTSRLSGYFKPLIKVLGITLICNITSELASDLGMGSVTGKIELAGKIAVIASVMPIFDTLLGEIERLV
ncbi:MAG: hypothetical protein E7613_06315 [Ruminococcaceae bacterium]|nr:hypothetical protein [Oscillospiraceae bacterium]